MHLNTRHADFFGRENCERRTATCRYTGKVDSVDVDNEWFGVVRKGTYMWQGVVGTTQREEDAAKNFNNQWMMLSFG